LADVVLPDGAKIAYDEYDFTAPWEPAEPIILVHGFSKNRRFWYSWIPELAAHYRVIRIDLRGHGDSSPIARESFQMGLRPFSQDLAHVLDGLGLKSAHFVMAEFSSAVAIDFANGFGDRIRSLTLPGFGHNYTAATYDSAEWARLASQEGAEAWARATNKYRLPADADPKLREWYIREQSRMPGWFLAALFSWAPGLDLTNQLAGIKVPTLILAGSAAAQGTIGQTRLAADAIPKCRLVVLDGMPFNVMTAAPEQCVAATLQFLNDVRRRAP
jgi:pimeloyl-ACP methyl ester carboxylesterase